MVIYYYYHLLLLFFILFTIYCFLFFFLFFCFLFFSNRYYFRSSYSLLITFYYFLPFFCLVCIHFIKNYFVLCFYSYTLYTPFPSFFSFITSFSCILISSYSFTINTVHLYSLLPSSRSRSFILVSLYIKTYYVFEYLYSLRSLFISIIYSISLTLVASTSFDLSSVNASFALLFYNDILSILPNLTSNDKNDTLSCMISLVSSSKKREMHE